MRRGHADLAGLPGGDPMSTSVAASAARLTERSFFYFYFSLVFVEPGANPFASRVLTMSPG